MEQTIGRIEGSTSKQLFTQVIRAEPKSDRKNSSRPKDIETVEENEGLNCLVYKIGKQHRIEKEEKKKK